MDLWRRCGVSAVDGARGCEVVGELGCKSEDVTKWRCHRSEEVTKVRLGEELIWRREESVMRRLDDETLADRRPFGKISL